MMHEFFMPMQPPTVTHQEKQHKVVNGKTVIYEPQELKATRAKLMAHLAQHKPPDPFQEGVELTAMWCFQATGKHKNGEFRITKPDTDNLQKLLKDCMTDVGFWRDDCLVAREIIEKYWAEMPGIYIKIQTLDRSEP